MAKAPSDSTDIVKIPEASEIQKTFKRLVKQASEITITDDASYRKVVSLGTGVKSLMAECDSTFNETIDLAHKTHKAACAAKNKWYKPLKELEKKIKAQIERYALDRQLEASIEQAQLNRQQAATESDRRNALADALDAADEGAAAELARTAPLTGPTAFVAPLPDVEGVRTKDEWYAEVTNEAEIPREYMTPDIEKLNQYARMMKGQASLPGVAFRKRARVSLSTLA